MIRRLLLTAACVGIAVLAPAAAASASTAKSADCCDSRIAIQEAPVFVPTRTVTYGSTIIPTAVASRCETAYVASACSDYGSSYRTVSPYGYGQVIGYGGRYRGGFGGGYGGGYGGGSGSGNNISSNSKGVGQGTGIGGLVGIGGIGVGIL